jgi:Ceramidase
MYLYYRYKNMKSTKKQNIGFIFIFLIILFSLIGVLMQEPITQDMNYHLFKDSRMFLGVPNFFNVLSNILFLLVGITGLYKIIVLERLIIINDIKFTYIFVFLGSVLVAVGSGYYHLWPDNNSLFWDRLPMTVTFMALFSVVISEFVSVRFGKAVLFPLIVIGLSSVFYWYFTENQGAGDLRFYVLIQFLPVLLMPVIFIFFKSSFNTNAGYWLLFIAYTFAKLFEYYDAEIYGLLGFISGHSIKHISAALGLYALLVYYEKRQLV